ncbi:hypothetical protein AB0M29_15250 [Streptomyces sp. NPDC051976]|uniref:hypothetical protein n=1 Tax=Streptomyces sp. NPDC051976 TaxID=3154947 RepID=UPI003436E6E7
MKRLSKIGLAASALTLATGLATTATAQASPHQATDSVPRPSINSVSFSGYYGTGVSSPTLTINGSGFGATPPPGASDNTTSCGGYTANGQVYGSQLYFVDDNNFEAGYSSVGAADCVGVSVVSWSPTKVVVKFGNAYGTFQHWYLNNGDGYALSVNGGIFGGTVSGLI